MTLWTWKFTLCAARTESIHIYHAVTVTTKVTQGARLYFTFHSSLLGSTLAALVSGRLAERRTVVGSDRQEGCEGNKEHTERVTTKDRSRRGENRQPGYGWRVGWRADSYLCLLLLICPFPISASCAGQRRHILYGGISRATAEGFLTAFINFAQQWNNRRRCGLFILRMYRTVRKKGGEMCGVGFTEWLLTEQTHCRGQRSPLWLIYCLSVMLGNRNRSDKAISILNQF